MRPLLRTLAPAALALAACRTADSGGPVAPGGDMDILVVIWDTTRADHLSAYGFGRETSPRLADIARSATVFAQANPGSYWTLSSVASLFSGMTSQNHGVDFDPAATGYVLDDDIVTLAEALGARGYRTALYTNQSLVKDNASLAQGFDTWAWVGPSEIAGAAAEGMDDPDPRPWFVVAYWLGGHAPYDPPEVFDPWSADGIDDINVVGCGAGDHYPEGWACYNDINSGAVTWTDEEWNYLRAKYDGQLLQHDTWLGALWGALEQRGLADTTFFAFTSDHGEALNDHGSIKAWHLWPTDDTQLVPLIVRLPGVFPATVRQEQVRTMDLYATLMELTGGPAEHAMDSRSLLEVVGDEDGDRVSAGATAVGGRRRWYRYGGWKFVASQDDEQNHPHELFDLVSDPMEQHNLWDELPEQVAALRAANEAYLAETLIPR